MISRTYAEYKGNILSWKSLLEKLNYSHNSNSSARLEFYDQATDNKLKNTK